MRRHDFYSSAEVKFAIKAEPIWTIELAASLKMIFVGSSSEREREGEKIYIYAPLVRTLKTIYPTGCGGNTVCSGIRKRPFQVAAHEQGSQMAHLT